MSERVDGIGGVFLRSDAPENLAAWYRDCLGVELATEFVGAAFVARERDVTVWAMFPRDSTYFPGAAMVNYRVRDLDAMLRQLRAAGAEVDGETHENELGRFGRAVDPEGNRFELWEPK